MLLAPAAFVNLLSTAANFKTEKKDGCAELWGVQKMSREPSFSSLDPVEMKGKRFLNIKQ